MSERVRNVLVGLTILAALAVSMYGIVLLGKGPSFSSLKQYKVTLTAPNANGIGAGTRVEFLGLGAGEVRTSYRSTDAQGSLVAIIELAIDNAVDLPAETKAVLQRSATGVGSPSVELSAASGNGPFLAKNGSAVIKASASDSGLIPKGVFDDIHDVREQLGATARELSTVAQDLHLLLVYTPPEALENVDPKNPNVPHENASTVIVRLNRTMKSLQDLLGDPKLQTQVREAVGNFVDASAQLKATLQKVDGVVSNANGAVNNFGAAATSINTAATRAASTLDSTQKDVDRVTAQLVTTLAQLDKTVHDLSEGKGTTGRLISDPRLYDGLLDLSKSLKSTTEDLDFLINKWKDEGVNLHLK